jgi:hypothetical protein
MQIKMSTKQMVLTRTSTEPPEHTLIFEVTGSQHEIQWITQRLQALMGEITVDALAPKGAR